MLLTTIIIATIVIILAVSFIGIGWILTGKSRIQAGSCGRAPKSKRDEECGTNVTCDLCKKDEDDVRQK